MAHVAHRRMDLDAASPQLGLGFPQCRLPACADGDVGAFLGQTESG
jgi:hypothetical protein